MTVKCDYCAKQADFVTGEKVYPHRPDLHRKTFYMCEPCGAWVGCHRNNGEPFGRLANAELRRWKMAAHRAFDPLWKEGPFDRNKAYKWLANQLEIKRADCHIGMFDIEMCRRVVTVSDRKRVELQENAA